VSLSRFDRILMLAWSLPDALRVLPSRSRDERRMAPATWHLCSPCDGTGNTRDRWSKATVCETCGGAGRYRTDPYADGAPVSGHADRAAPTHASRRVSCDRCSGQGVIPTRWLEPGSQGLAACPSCDGTGGLHLPLVETGSGERGVQLDSVAWTIAGGDWPALDTALERMRCNGRRPLWRAFVTAYVEEPYETSSLSTAALNQVSELMPTRVRVPNDVIVAYRDRSTRAQAARAARSKRMGRDHRNRDIREALRLGHSTEDVARRFALSERTIRRVA